jgi:FKBP-type peptidyl-prolyl cis-trans isomerase (trigger factor)
VPHHLTLRQQKSIFSAIQQLPDYNVYRMQKDFFERVKQLAEKQTKEHIFIDCLACHEHLDVTNEDVKTYLNLTKRPRTKEFLYFTYPINKYQGQNMPIPTEELKRSCLREKAINYVIYHLTKKY